MGGPDPSTPQVRADSEDAAALSVGADVGPHDVGRALKGVWIRDEGSAAPSALDHAGVRRLAYAVWE